MLAAAALIARPRAERLWIAGFAALLLAVIFGLPPFVQIATRLPLFSLGHNERLILLALACLALLAGWGLDDLLSREAWERHRRAILVAAAVLLAIPFVWVALKSDIDRKLPAHGGRGGAEAVRPARGRRPRRGGRDPLRCACGLADRWREPASR